MDDRDTSTAEATPVGRPFQFTLRTMLVITAAVALSLGLVMWLQGLGVLLILLGLAGIAAYRRAWQMVAILIMVTIIIPCLMPAMNSARSPRPGTVCINNMRQLAIALHCYHNDYGSFPPAYIADANGKPMHSWRVLLLPYLGYSDLYDAYRFDEPWDGPNNCKLHGQIPDVFRCPCEPQGANSTETNYVAVIGVNTAWRGATPVKMSDIVDGHSSTILLVETTASGIHWLEPRDLVCPPMPVAVNPSPIRGISSRHTGGANVVFVDGCGYYLREGDKRIAGFLTIDGGEKVSMGDP